MKRAGGLPLLCACLGIAGGFILVRSCGNLLPAAGGLPRLCSTILSFPLILFVPGVFLSLVLSGRRTRGMLEFLLGNMGISIILLIAVTTLMKCFGVVISHFTLTAAVSVCLLGGYFCYLMRGTHPTLVDDLSSRWVSLACLGAALIWLYLCFGNFFTWDVHRLWVAAGNFINPIDPAQQLTDWRFPRQGELAHATVSYRADGGIVEERRLRTTGREVEISLHSSEPSPQQYVLMLFFQSGMPLTMKAYHNTRLLEERAIRRLIDVRCEHLFPRSHRLAWRRAVTLAPGENMVRIVLDNPANSELDVVIDDFSNLTKKQFLEIAGQRFLFGEIGVFYDNIEVLDLSRHFFTRSFTYTDDLRPGRPGYTIVIPPHDFFIKMFFLCTGRNDIHDLKYLYLARLVVLYLVFLLYFGDIGRAGSSWFTALPIFVILADSVNLINFRVVGGHDIMMCTWFLLAAYYLVKGNNAYFFLFAAFLCLTRNHGIIFALFALLSHSIFFGQLKRLLKLLGGLFILGLVYAAIVFAIGHTTGVLAPIWLEDFINENFHFRFDAARRGLDVLGKAGIFFWWLVVTSCFQCALLMLRKDRLSKYLLLVVALYFPVICLARSYKPYYPIMIVYPLSIVAARSLAQMASRRIRIAAGRRTILRFDSREALFLLLLLVGALCVAYLAVAPLIYPEFTTSFPSLYFRIFPTSS